MHIHDRIALNHLDRMTDSTGLVQHAIYTIPRRESGYTTDDNARALRLCARLWCQQPDQRMLSRVIGYLSFLEYARCPGRGFHNFMSYQRTWLDAEGCGDCQGQAVRALAEVLGSSLPDEYRALARELIDSILPTLADLRSLRAQAYVILAWGHLWTAGVKGIDLLENVAWSAAQRLAECYQRAIRPDWQWFESRMTYANAVLPHALFVSARRWPNEAFLEVAETSFAFLDRATTAEIRNQESGVRCQESGVRSQESGVRSQESGVRSQESGVRSQESRVTCQESMSPVASPVIPDPCPLTPDPCPLTPVFWPIGNSGWYPHGEDKAAYDQQPVEAVTMADAALSAFGLLNDPKHLATFRRARGWFHGQNSLGQPLVDVACGACCDGLQASGVSRNQGAESTLAYLWTELHNFEFQRTLGDNRKDAIASA